MLLKRSPQQDIQDHVVWSPHPHSTPSIAILPPAKPKLEGFQLQRRLHRGQQLLPTVGLNGCSSPDLSTVAWKFISHYTIKDMLIPTKSCRNAGAVSSVWKKAKWKGQVELPSQPGVQQAGPPSQKSIPLQVSQDLDGPESLWQGSGRTLLID